MTAVDRPGLDAPPRPWIPAVVGAAIFVLSVLLFREATGFAFVNLDDQTYVTSNAMVLRGLTWDGVAWAFSSTHGSNWHPLTWLSHMADVEVFGLDPGRHHLVSVVLHAANAVLLLVWLRRATGSPWRSAFAATVFAVHPIHVESVAWVSERKDVLSTFFWLFAMIAWVDWVRSRGALRYAAVVAAFVLGLLAKPMVITLPFALLLVDAWPLGRLREGGPGGTAGRRAALRLVREKWPLFAIAAGAGIATVVAQRGSAAATLEAIPMGQRLANAVVSYGAYLRDTLWPANLAAFYPHPSVGGPGPSLVAVSASAAVLAAVTVLAVAWRKRFPFVLWGWLWFLGTLVPVIGLVQVGLQSHADRYAYIPSIGLVVAVAWLVGATAQRSRAGRIAVGVGAVTAVLALSVATSRQVLHWRSSEALWRHALEATGDNWQAWNGLGDALLEAGRVPEAIAAQRQSLRIRPGNRFAWNDLGLSLGQAGQVEAAAGCFERAIALDPEYADAWYNLGTAYGLAGDHARAVNALERATTLRPGDARLWANLAVARQAVGDARGASDAVSRVEALDPALAARLRGPAARER